MVRGDETAVLLPFVLHCMVDEHLSRLCRHGFMWWSGGKVMLGSWCTCPLLEDEEKVEEVHMRRVTSSGCLMLSGIKRRMRYCIFSVPTPSFVTQRSYSQRSDLLLKLNIGLWLWLGGVYLAQLLVSWSQYAPTQHPSHYFVIIELPCFLTAYPVFVITWNASRLELIMYLVLA